VVYHRADQVFGGDVDALALFRNRDVPRSIREAIICPVDYNNPTAVDPDPGTSFVTQAELDAWLVAHGATAIKHVAAAWRSFNLVGTRLVTLSLAAGVHRPMNPDPLGGNAAWSFDQKTPLSTRIPSSSLRGMRIIGAPPSQWLPVVATPGAPLIVTSVDSGSVSEDPTVGVSGTPFLGLDIKGWYAVFNTGQTTVIHDHTASALRVCANVSPTPTSVWVGRPSTILRNSIDDATDYKSGAIFVDMADPNRGTVMLQDLSVEPFQGGGVHISTLSCRFVGTRLLIDGRTPYEAFSVAPNGRVFQDGGHVPTFLTDVSVVNTVAGQDGALWVISAGSSASLNACYFRLTESSWFSFGYLILRNTVFDEVGNLSEGEMGSIIMTASDLCPYKAAPFGKKNEIRNVPSGISAIALLERASIAGVLYRAPGGVRDTSLIIKDVAAAPCVRLGRDCRVWLTDTPTATITDGGNPLATCGFQFYDEGSTLDLDDDTAITGIEGDVKFTDQTTATYSDIRDNGPLMDGYGNLARGKT